MAKEITSNLSVSIAPLGASKATGQSQLQEDLIGGVAGFEVTLGNTSASPISLGAGVPAPKVVYIQNLDAVNFVTIDNVIGLTNWPQKLLPGASIVLRPLSTALFGKADTLPVDIWVVAG
jgi:hypothetical protein